MTNEIKIKSTVAKIIRKLDLIMISVYMNQSLILLKDELGWNMEDILYFTINKRSNDSKPDLPNELKDKIRSWNRADSALFDAVNSTFWSKIEAFGFTKMETEVKNLRNLIDERMKFCVAEISVLSQEERLKQCPKCKGDSELQKYILTEKGRALSQRPSTFFANS